MNRKQVHAELERKIVAAMREDPLKRVLLDDGWEYRDWEPMAEAKWDSMLLAIGLGNVVPLTERRGGGRARGQLLVSPVGLANLAAWGKVAGLPKRA